MVIGYSNSHKCREQLLLSRNFDYKLSVFIHILFGGSIHLLTPCMGMSFYLKAIHSALCNYFMNIEKRIRKFKVKTAQPYTITSFKLVKTGKCSRNQRGGGLWVLVDAHLGEDGCQKRPKTCSRSLWMAPKGGILRPVLS